MIQGFRNRVDGIPVKASQVGTSKSGVSQVDGGSWIAILVRWVLVFILWVSPWYYAGASWTTQYLLFFPGAVLAVALGLLVVFSKAERSRLIAPPLVAWVLLFLGLFAQFQALRNWDIEGQDSWRSPSLQIQRWALGITDSSEQLCDFSGLEPEDRRIAISVESLTTKGASSSLFLCALLVWGASAVWGHRKSYPQFLVALTVLGVLIGTYGLLGVFMRSSPNLLGLTYGSSFSVFVSKNSAGAFLNIILAAAIGLAVWCAEKVYGSVVRQMKSRDMRQWPWNAKFQYALKTAYEKIDAKLIASSLTVLFVAFCVAISLCRGAFASAMLAVFFAVAIAWPGKKRNALLFGSFIAMLCAVFAMASLQLDQTVINRIESIEKLDLESEKQSGRLYIWGVAGRAAMHYGWLGSGLGTFHVASLPFQSPSSRGWYYHAESLFAEIIVTLGYIGAIATILALLTTLLRLLGIYHSDRFRDYLPLQVAGAFFLASQVLHACIDFAWVLPGVYIPSALFLGILLGGYRESKRAFSRIHNLAQSQVSMRERLSLGAAGASFACLCLVFILVNQRSVSVLALGERIESQLRLDAFPGDLEDSQKFPSMVDRWVDTCADAYTSTKVDTVYRSPALLRLLADSIVYDTRVERWNQRPVAASAELAWSQTRPVVLRLAMESATENDRAMMIESLGGNETLDRFEKANYWYRRGQLLSPLDWRMLWGRITTALRCSPSQMKPLLPGLSKLSAHRPANLTSGSLIFNGVLDDQERLDLWQPAIRADKSEAIPIARIMAKSYQDGKIPIEALPDDPQVLRTVYNEVFTEKDFPTTHALLADKLVQASLKTPWTGLRKANWMADVARETGKVDLEIDNLTIILGLDRSNVPDLKRLITLLIESKQKEKARGFVRQLVRAAPSDPAIDIFNQQLAGLEP